MIGKEYDIRWLAADGRLKIIRGSVPSVVDVYEGKFGGLIQEYLFKLNLADQKTGRGAQFDYFIPERDRNTDWAEILKRSLLHTKLRIDVFSDGSYRLPVVLETMVSGQTA